MTSVLKLPEMLDEIKRELRTADLSDAFRDCQTIIARDIGGHFERSETPEGVAWLPRKDNLPHPLLILSGATPRAATGGAGSIFEMQARSMTYGVSSSIVYAGAQNFGSTKRNIPQREFLGLSEVAVDACETFIATTIDGSI